MEPIAQKDLNPRAWQPFWLALPTGLLVTAAFYPFEWPWAAWFSTLGLLYLICQKELPGKRPYLKIWLGLLVGWLVLFQCVRLPHWAGYIGWPLLSAYLCSYPFLFVVLARYLVWRVKLPFFLVVPITWTGLEYIQAHLFTGISLGMQSHTQVAIPVLAQVADIAGCYTISFCLMGTLAGLSSAFFVLPDPAWWSSRWIGVTTGLLIAVLWIGYGSWRLSNAEQQMTTEDFEIALIQGSIDTKFPSTSDEQKEYFESIRKHYEELSIKSRQIGDPQLIIWPESMFPAMDMYSLDDEVNSFERMDLEKFAWNLEVVAGINSGAIEVIEGDRLVRVRPSIPMLVGANSAAVQDSAKVYNSALMIGSSGKVTGRYAKMKLVLFGEFVPLGDVFPWLYNFFPMGAGLRAGDSPTALKVEAGRIFYFSPNVCFESTYPHLIRRHVTQLSAEGTKPDCLVNVTNDGWFWGSNALDMHLANTRLRAIENRTSVLIAANTGISGQIDPFGQIIARGGRRKAEVIQVKLITSKATSLYHQIGDWPWFFAFLFVLGGFFAMLWQRFRGPKLQSGIV